MELRPAHEDELSAIFEVDEDATALYAAAGIVIDLPPTHPFALEERERWRVSVRRGDTFVATSERGVIGFAAIGVLDGAPYLDQLSVRRDAMRRGIGSALVEAAWTKSRGELWLNTYGHVAWNRPFYERRGFARVPENAWRPEMRAIVASQRVWLPAPDQRVVMRRVR